MDKYVTVVGGLGLFLLGMHHLTEGLKGLAGDSLRRALQAMVGGRLSAVVSGALFTVLIQSSTATTLTVTFVSAGLVTFAQSVGVIIGATFGTTSTPWLVAIFGFRLRILLLLCRCSASVAFSGLLPRAKRVRPGRSWPDADCCLSASNTCKPEWKGFRGISTPSEEAVSAGNGSSPESGF